MSNTLNIRRAQLDAQDWSQIDKLFAPLFQRSVGFDRLYNHMNSALQQVSDSNSYPPYDIVQKGENLYTITLAVAGFDKSEIAVRMENGHLVVEGNKAKKAGEEEVKYLHRGISTRKFRHRFQLTEYIRVEGARFENGLLHIALVREVPEALKPRTIEITSA